jgi:tRNA pseudouridine13 synthase
VLSFVPAPETFVVEEIPAYAPAGAGEHTFLWIEKQGLTTLDAIRHVAVRLGVDARDVGYAGLKDRHAVTRQWLSVPGVDPARALGLTAPGLAVLQAERHGNKLRVGHLRGNRFEVVLAGDAGDAEVEALRASLAELGRSGVANRYGGQRFGAAGDNAAAGLAILRGQRRERDRRRRKLLLSAAQSAVFNRTLELRAGSGAGLRAVRTGDVLQKIASGGLFITEDVAADQARVDAGEIVPTGPLPGTREKEPPPGSEARALEDAALADVGATREDFARAGRELPGARRPVLVAVTLGDPPLAEEPPPPGAARAVRLRFTLPAGSYATVLVTALTGLAADTGAGNPEPPSTDE